MTKGDLLDHATQLAIELLDGSVLKANLQHMKREGTATQEEVNEVTADLEFLRRNLRIAVDRAEAIIAGAQLPPAADNPRLDEVRARLRKRQA